MKKLRIMTKEKEEYCDHWASNAAHFETQACYDWMAERLKPLAPKRILDIGCGTGQGLLALLRAFSPTIVSLDENAACLKHSLDSISSAGYSVSASPRIGYEEFQDGSHSMYLDDAPIETTQQVTLVHADILMDDPAMLRLFAELPKFDAVTVWLAGTYMMRQTCRNISSLRIANSNEYRLHVQNRVYAFADCVLRPGGWLQAVDRGEPQTKQSVIDETFRAHRDQAKKTSLEVFDVNHRSYTEPTERGIRMVASVGNSEKAVDLKELAMLSIPSSKPMQ